MSIWDLCPAVIFAAYCLSPGVLGKHTAGTNVSRKSLRWDWRLEANLNRKANGLALERPSVGLYVPLLEFNLEGLLERVKRPEPVKPGDDTAISQLPR